ncbi:MAG TPA: TIM barrel protein, partial [Armatimonadota bacterium]|nr:TIM barrel protein [Armatimonadota bacterium]
MSRIDRRRLLGAAALAPVALSEIAGRPAAAQAPQGDVPPPKYVLSGNMELMFPRDFAHADRIRLFADQGLKAFSFWEISGKDADAMERAQKQTGLECGSITGNGKTGWGTGLTKTGYEKAFLDDIMDHIEVAKRFGCKNLITFVGAVQKDIPWEVQQRQVVDGLKRAGDLAEKHDVYIVLEPLNNVESAQMSMLTSAEAFKYAAEANHPRVKVDYDMYHRQLGEGNIINNLRLGLQKGWIRFVEVGDVPGRKEPGSGETNYANIFKVLREQNYAGFVGLEHGSTSTPRHAMEAVRRL